MKDHVLDYTSYVNEALLQKNWVNYKTGTDVALDEKSSDAAIISDKVLNLIGVTDASELLFTSSEIGASEDFTFINGLINNTQPQDIAALQFDNYVVYFSKFIYQEKSIIKVDVKYTYELSYVFIKEADFEFFSELAADENPALPPEETEEEKAVRLQQAAVPTTEGPTPVGSTVA